MVFNFFLIHAIISLLIILCCHFLVYYFVVVLNWWFLFSYSCALRWWRPTSSYLNRNKYSWAHTPTLSHSIISLLRSVFLIVLRNLFHKSLANCISLELIKAKFLWGKIFLCCRFQFTNLWQDYMLLFELFFFYTILYQFS